MLKEIGDFLERPAGHYTMLFGLLGVGFAGYGLGWKELAHDVTLPSVGALLMLMKGTSAKP